MIRNIRAMLLFLGVITLAAGCVLGIGGTDKVYLRHTETGHTVECGPYKYALNIPDKQIAFNQERACITDYQRQGYERVPREKGKQEGGMTE